MTSANSATTNYQTDLIRDKLPPHFRIILPHYLTPSLNTLLGKHWSVLLKEKKKAALALSSALRGDRAMSSIWTILQEAANHSSINLDMPNSSRTMIRKASNFNSSKKKSKRAWKKKPSSTSAHKSSKQIQTPV